jgi:putative tryptophan/tyrosine transport system permease protein
MTVWIGSLALGLALACMALGVYLSFRVLDFPDLTVDGSLPLGAAISAALIINYGWQPWLPLPPVLLAGALAGMATALLNTRLKINGILAGILVSFGLWTVNLRIMADRANLPLLGTDTVLTPFRAVVAGPAQLAGVDPGNIGNVTAIVVFLPLSVLVGLALNWFLHTELGLAMRSTGDNERMACAMGINPAAMKTLNLALSNALVSLAGAFTAQYQGFADVNLGLGTIVAGLAAVIIGETLLRPSRPLGGIVSVLLGSVLYRLIIGAALVVGLGPSDFRLVTALIVIAALGLPQIRSRLRVRAWQAA